MFSRVGQLPSLGDEDAVPKARCGHTLTALDPENARKLILFGGATALENSGGGAAAAAGIRLAGATNDVHCFDIAKGAWSKLAPLGEAPSPRAAHAAAAVGSMVVMQGGIGPAGLATDDLYVLDLAGTPRWHRVVVQGEGPGARYAHVLALVGQRFLLVLGGNDGYKPLADAWALDTAMKPYKWQSVQATGEGPCARMYAAAAARADGLLLLCGGRDANNSPLADVFGLARHRDGRWEWAAAPVVAPTPRYQHAVACIGARLHASGGALGGGKMVDEKHCCVVLDSAAGSWTTADVADEMSLLAGQRCRHAVAAVGSCLFLYGGLCGGSLLDDLVVAEDARADDGMAGDTVEQLSAIADLSSPGWQAWLADAESRKDEAHAAGVPPPASTPPKAGAQAAVIQALTPPGVPPVSAPISMPVARMADPVPIASSPVVAAIANRLRGDSPSAASSSAFAIRSANSSPTERSKSPFSGLGKSPNGTLYATPDVRLHHRAVLVAAGDDSTGALGGLVRQLSIDQFENESRRVSIGTPGFSDARRTTPIIERGASALAGIHKSVLAVLLRPREWKPQADRSFFLDVNMIRELCDRAEACLSEDPIVLQLAAPVKIFGDLHGQFGDLMRLFSEYGSPSTAGDIAYIDYLFLGDYVDRGAFSLETMTLLLALKIEHPKNVHLLRGNHEAADINALFGFRMECVERLGEEHGIWAWERFNTLFNWMPLAAVIEKRVICMHGGIGKSVESVEQLETLVRPLTMENGGSVLMDLFDPTENDSITGLRPNARGPGLVTFGPDRVKEFLETNNLQMIIRAHECVMDGFERFAAGQLITVFSATDYCGTARNAGAILVLGRDLTLYPKLIHPLPPQAAFDDDVSEGASPMGPWITGLNSERPPTPPRGRVGAGGARPSLDEF